MKAVQTHKSNYVFDATEAPFSVDAPDTAVSSGGMTELITLPFSFYEEIKQLARAIKHFDAEAIVECTGRLLNIPFGFAYAAQNLAIIILVYLQAATIFLLNATAYITGRIFVAFEILLEAGRLYHLDQFESKLDLGDLAQYKNNDLLLCRKLEWIQNTYFRLSEEEVTAVSKMARSVTYQDPLRGKLNSLSRKIRPWLVRELHSEIGSVIIGIRQSDPEMIHRGFELLEQIQIQIDKTRKVYYVGLIALFIAMVVFGLTIIAAPYMLPILITIGTIGTVLEFGRWFAPACYLDQKDHKWHSDPWLPSCFRNTAITTPQNTRHKAVELVTVEK